MIYKCIYCDRVSMASERPKCEPCNVYMEDSPTPTLEPQAPASSPRAPRKPSPAAVVIAQALEHGGQGDEHDQAEAVLDALEEMGYRVVHRDASPRDLEAVPADGLRMICRSYMYVQAGPLRDAANWIARVLAAKDFPQETEAWKRAHPPKGETPSEAAGDLEAMFAQGEIIGYEIDRMPGKASVRLEWMEYAENCPEGWSSTGRGYGPDVPAALEAAKKKMPRKDPQ